MDFEELDDGEENIPPEQPIRTKGKRKTYKTEQNGIFVEVKSKRRSGKCVGAAQLKLDFVEPEPIVYNTISDEIWQQVSKYIPPEGVRTFALICCQAAEIMNSREFWMRIYKIYCSTTVENPWKLPEHLQFVNLDKFDVKTLRLCVVETLFHCYEPFMDRLKRGYTLNMLLGYTYEASWYEHCHRIWIMCYKFCNKLALDRKKRENVNTFPINDEVNDWESLADDETWCLQQPTAHAHTHEGVFLLVIGCDRFKPFPNNWLCERAKSQVQLSASKQYTSKGSHSKNLELEFRVHKDTKTVLYPKIVSCEVLPWWHPDFRKFMK